ncbi:MAG: hypothetical protein SGPRY_010766 [Prymnesium sp.]
MSGQSLPLVLTDVLTMATASASLVILGSPTFLSREGSIVSFLESEPGTAIESSDVTRHFVRLADESAVHQLPLVLRYYVLRLKACGDGEDMFSSRRRPTVGEVCRHRLAIAGL